MEIPPLAKIEQTTRDAPENLIFSPVASLITVVSDTERYSEDCRMECLAELIARWYLNPVDEIENCLDSAIPTGEWHSLKKIQEQNIFAVPTAASLPQKLWSSSDSFPKRCEVVVRKRLRDLLNADGFIPVYWGENAFFLPFSLVENERIPWIGDAAGNSIAAWQEPYQTLFTKNPQYRCVIHCRLTDYLPSFTGHSLMLPLYLAYMRKTGELPQYNILRLLSTGAIENKYLKAVETAEKKHALERCFSHAYLFFPESSKTHSEERYSVPLNITFDLGKTLAEIRKQIEAKGLVIPTFHDAIIRLKSLDYETRHASQNQWKMMIDRLQVNMDAIKLSRDRDPESYLLCLMLKSAIYCHMGNTIKALEFNEQAKTEAHRLHLEKPLRRLEIEELVELQDVEDFNSIRLLAGTLKADVERLDDDDLLMRYCGTMGQAHCYGSLAGISGFERGMAKDYFIQALSHAYKLNSEQDIAQDLNYNYLWYVLFDPASEGAALTYAQANDHIERNLQEFPECQKKNRYFLQRFKMQALYRRLLRGEKSPFIDYQSEELPEEADSWLRALVKKYLGAIAAANGDTRLAGQFFSDAVALLERDRNDNIIAYIRMTVLAEAYRSLHDEPFCKETKAALDDLSKKYSLSVTPWEKFLDGGGEFPELKYWY